MGLLDLLDINNLLKQIDTLKKLYKKRPKVVVLFFLLLVGYGIFYFRHPIGQFICREKLKPFKQGTFGILIAAFEGKTEEQKTEGEVLQGTIRSTLNARFQELKIYDTEAREIPSSLIPFIRTHNEARDIGREYNAEIVVWGTITMPGIIPNITIVRQNSDSLVIIKPNTSLLKETLTHAALANISDIRLPPLTDEITILVSFVTGLKYYKEGQYSKALDYFTKSIPKYNSEYLNNAYVYFYIGNCNSFIKEYERAISDYTKALEINPKLAEVYYNRGATYSRKQEYDKAISDYTKSLEINPKLAEAYGNRGATYFHKQEYDKAIADYTKALEINPKLTKTYSYRGIAYFRKQEYEKAIADYTKALEINPKYAEAYSYRGIAYFRKQEYEKAIADYTKALEINPKLTETYSNRGTAYSRKQEYERAVSDYTKALEINPKYAEAYYNIGCLYSIQNQADFALMYLQKAIEFGYDDYAYIKEDKDWDNIRGYEAFQKIIGKY
jgi:tetratricopeptide (TPR) repeat protein